MWLGDFGPFSAVCLGLAYYYYAERLTCNVQWAVNEVIALFPYNFCFFLKLARNTFFKFVYNANVRQIHNVLLYNQIHKVYMC
jgi:hypothetical protein